MQVATKGLVKMKPIHQSLPCQYLLEDTTNTKVPPRVSEKVPNTKAKKIRISKKVLKNHLEVFRDYEWKMSYTTI